MGVILRYSIEHNNIFAFRLILSLPRKDLIFANTIDLDKEEPPTMLAALYGSIDILKALLEYFWLEHINKKTF